MIQSTSSTFIPSTPSKPTPGAKLDKDAFLKLLTTQMQYQDPMNPSSQDQMFGTLTQMGVLEQMTNLNSNTTNLVQANALSLIGKSVKALDADGKPIQGTVKQIDYASGVPSMMINGKPVAFKDLQSVIQLQ